MSTCETSLQRGISFCHHCRPSIHPLLRSDFLLLLKCVNKLYYKRKYRSLFHIDLPLSALLMVRIRTTRRYPWLLRYYDKGLKRKPWAKAFVNYWASKHVFYVRDSPSYSSGSGKENSQDSPVRKRRGENCASITAPTSGISSDMSVQNESASETSSIWNTFLEGSETELSEKDETDYIPKLKREKRCRDSSSLEEQTSEDSGSKDNVEHHHPEQCDAVDHKCLVSKSAFLFESLSIVVAVFHHPCTVVFCGKAQIQVLYGSLRVLGYDIMPDHSKPLPVFSSPDYCLLTFTTEENEAKNSLSKESIFRDMMKLGLSELVEDVGALLTSSSVVVVLHKLDINEVTYACQLVREVFHFPRNLGNPDAAKHKATFKRFGFCLLPTKIMLPYWNCSPYASRINTLLNSVSSLHGLRVLVCGGKNVGKSTFVRYLMNSVLNSHPEVCHFEADPGQTEFTPSTCLSLTKVSSPIFGPPFTNQIKPDKTICLGSLNIADIPEVYIDSVTALYEHYVSTCNGKPLFVNTMGWNAGLGLALLIDVIHIIKPTHVIQLRSENNDKSQNLPYMTSDYVLTSYGWKFNTCQMKELSDKYNWMLLNTAAGATLPNSPPSAPARRSLMILAYLGKLQSEFYPFRPLNFFTPYVVPWVSVGIFACRHDVAIEQILCSLNCSWVALCHTDDENLITLDNNQPIRVCSKVPMNECLGFGIIRGIDPRLKLFYVITPESLQVLKKVNLLLRVNTNFPDILLTEQTCQMPIPYLTRVSKPRKKNSLSKAVVKRAGTSEYKRKPFRNTKAL